MQLSTWTLYEASHLIDVKGQKLISDELVFLILKPDFIQPNRLLGLGIPKNKSATKVVDLQNKILSHDDIYNIFANHLGVIEMGGIKYLEMGGVNWSTKPIRAENTITIREVYNLFFKTAPIVFETNDYADFKKHVPDDVFNETDLTQIPLRNILKNLQLGMQEYNRQMIEIRESKASEEDKKNKIVNLSILQSNLIALFDETLKKVNTILMEKDKLIKELRQEK